MNVISDFEKYVRSCVWYALQRDSISLHKSWNPILAKLSKNRDAVELKRKTLMNRLIITEICNSEQTTDYMQYIKEKEFNFMQEEYKERSYPSL